MTADQYQSLYQQSLQNPEDFWDKVGKEMIDWFHPWQTVMSGNFIDCNVSWFSGAQLNACYNCLDRHLKDNANKTAIIWQGNDDHESKTLTYAELYEQVCRLSNGLKKLGVKKGDRVCIYMPMIIEAPITMLASARIGAVHSVVFAGFSPKALQNRIQDAGAKILITANENIHGAKHIPLKANADLACPACPSIENVIVVNRSDAKIDWVENRDIDYHQLTQSMPAECEPEPMDADDPLFILYTSGSTGQPKGVVHTTAGYLVYSAFTFKTIFNYQPNDIFWCTADIGWITGHTYVTYGPLCNAATIVICEGVPTYPDASRSWKIVDKYKVTIFYTAPTAIRALMREGDEYLKSSTRGSLKLLGTVGEPINPAVWQWYYDSVGHKKCPIIDTWWQTETGGSMLSPIPYATPLKPGSVSWPFFGIKPVLIDDDGNIIEGEGTGKLAFSQPWPGLMKTIFGDHQRFIDTYFKEFPGLYLSGDAATRDKDGDYWINGRIDDVINVSGHRIGTAEIESALVSDPHVSEAAVVGCQHPIKGQAIYAFVTLKEPHNPTDELKKILVQTTRKIIGPFAAPEVIQFTSDLPKTRSGKIMRRILRKIANHDTDDLGDTSTLSNPEVVDALIAEARLNK